MTTTKRQKQPAEDVQPDPGTEVTEQSIETPDPSPNGTATGTGDTGKSGAAPSRPDAATKPIPAEPRRRRSEWRTVKRVFLTLLVVAIVGAAAVAAWPFVNERVIQPISDNTAQVSALQADLADAEARISELESQLVSILAAEGGLPARLDDIEGRLAGVETLTADLSEQLGVAASDLEDLSARVNGIDGSVADVSGQLEAVAATLDAEGETLRAMELLSRARLFLYQANYGLAEQDLVAARALLAASADAAATQPVIERLDSAIEALPDRPVLAADELDIAWASLLDGDAANPEAPADSETVEETP